MGLFDKKKKQAQEAAAVEAPVGQEAAKERVRGMYTLVARNIYPQGDNAVTITGIVSGDTIEMGDEVYLIGRERHVIKTRVAGMTDPRKGNVQQAQPGTEIELLFAGVMAKKMETAVVVSNVCPVYRPDRNQPVVNPRIKGFLAERKNPEFKDLAAYCFEETAMNGVFLSVVLFSSEPTKQEDGRVLLEKGTQIQFPMLTTTDQRTVYPVFTDQSEVQKWEKRPENKTMIVPFDRYAAMIMGGKADGLVINPFSDNLMLDRKMIEHLSKQRDVTLKAMAEAKAREEQAKTEQDKKEEV